MKQSILIVTSIVSSTTAFTPFARKASTSNPQAVALESLDSTTTSKPIFDPLGLYPKEAPERKAGIIQPLEGSIDDANSKNIVLDPLQLYGASGDASNLSTDEASASLPFLSRPLHLDGSMAGDRGFDPFNLASNPDNLLKYRNSELKHARLAMLAAVGWPLAELFHSDLAGQWHLPNALNINDRVPSVLNGGLGNISPIFWIGAVTAAALVEAFSGAAGEIQSADLGFDPLGIMSSENQKQARFLADSELFNGRLAMLAITGFAIQEFATGNSVVDAIPIFFKPFNVVLEQILASGGATSV